MDVDKRRRYSHYRSIDVPIAQVRGISPSFSEHGRAVFHVGGTVFDHGVTCIDFESL